MLFALVCIFSLSHSRGSICARILAFSLGQEVEKSIAMHVHGDRERLYSTYSTHYIYIPDTEREHWLRCRESERGCSQRSTHRRRYPLCCVFNWKQPYKGTKLGATLLCQCFLSGAHLVSVRVVKRCVFSPSYILWWNKCIMRAAAYSI